MRRRPAQNNGLFSTTRPVAHHSRVKPHEKTAEKSGSPARTAEDRLTLKFRKDWLGT
jgi:hypothetical protein